MVYIDVPTINSGPNGFGLLSQIQRQARDAEDELVFRFDDCHFLQPHAIAFLGCLARKLNCSGKITTFDWITVCDQAVFAVLRQNGFACTFGHYATPWNGNSIPYREDVLLSRDNISDYLVQKWLGNDWVHVSDALRNVIVGNVWEVYANAFEHGSSGRDAIVSCGQHFPQSNKLVLSVVDMGDGFVNKVRSFFQRGNLHGVEQIRSDSCMRWAFDKGNSTRGKISSGLGLFILKEFIRLNNGKLEIYSNDGYACVDLTGEHFKTTPFYINGTIVNIVLCCDEKSYCMLHELTNSSQGNGQ